MPLFGQLNTLLGELLMVYLLPIIGSWLVVEGSWLMAHGPWPRGVPPIIIYNLSNCRDLFFVSGRATWVSDYSCMIWLARSR